MHCDHVTVARKMLVGSEDSIKLGDGMGIGNLKGGNNTGCFHLDPGLVRGGSYQHCLSAFLTDRLPDTPHARPAETKQNRIGETISGFM